MKKQAIIVFTRLPVAGATKTRLMTRLSGVQCAALHWALLADLAVLLQALDMDLFVFYTPEGQNESLLQLKSLYNKAHYVLQRGLGLGARMNAAFSYVLRQGYAYSLLIGSDIPLITCEDITDAASILMTRDVVLGPCDDGGYWLVGLKKPFPQMFFGQHYDDLARGGESVLATARETCCFYNKTHGLAAKKCDIDTFDDFLYYQQRVNELQSPHLYRFFRDCECR